MKTKQERVDIELSNQLDKLSKELSIPKTRLTKILAENIKEFDIKIETKVKRKKW